MLGHKVRIPTQKRVQDIQGKEVGLTWVTLHGDLTQSPCPTIAGSQRQEMCHVPYLRV
jgi:hypothetical protein